MNGRILIRVIDVRRNFQRKGSKDRKEKQDMQDRKRHEMHDMTLRLI